VFAGDPFGCDEGERAGLYGQVDLCVVEMARSFGEIGGDADGRGLREGWRGDGDERGEKEAAG
jgi:hypothetical protein